MAPPITFRNVPGVSAPDFGSSLFAIQRATDTPNLLDSLGKVAETAVQDQQNIDTDAFIAQLNNFRDQNLLDGGVITADDQRQQFLGQQLQDNSFIDAGLANKAVTQSRAQDFLTATEGRNVTAEERAVQDQILQEDLQKDNLLTSAANRVTNKLNNKATQARLDREAKNNKSLDARNAEQEAVFKENARLRKAGAANRALQSDSTISDLDPIAISPGLQAQDPSGDNAAFFQETRNRLHERIRSDPKFSADTGVTDEQIDKKIDDIFKRSNLLEREKAANADAARTPAERIAFNQQQESAAVNVKFDKVIDTTADKLNVIGSDTEFVNEWVKFNKQFNARERLPKQWIRRNAIRDEAIRRFIPSTAGDILLTTPVDQIKSQDLAAFDKRISKQIFSKFPDASSEEVLALTRVAKENGENNLGTKLATAQQTADSIAQISQIGANNAVQEITSEETARVGAKVEGDVDRAKTDDAGDARSKVRQVVADFFKPGNTGNPDNLNVDQDDLTEQTTRLYNLTTETFPSMSEGKKRQILSELIKGEGQIEDEFFSDAQIGLIDADGDVDSINDFSDADLLDKVIGIAANRGSTKAKNLIETRKLERLKDRLAELEGRNAVGNFIGLGDVEAATIEELKIQIEAQELKVKK